LADVDVTEIASQVAEQVGQSVSQAIQKLLQSTGQTSTGAGVFTKEELGDIGGTENIEAERIDRSGLIYANMKRTYDEYQHESLESIKRNRSYVDKILTDANTLDNQAKAIANQALQNAVETANMVGKQAVRHGDIAIDNQWNPVQQGAADAMTIKAVQLDDASVKAIAAALAAAFAETVAQK